MSGERSTGPGPQRLLSIGEASAALGEPDHVLRFWEREFSALNPVKQAGGRRLYRPRDMETLRRIQALLRRDGMTIRGARRVLRGAAESGGRSPDELRALAARLRSAAAELSELASEGQG